MQIAHSLTRSFVLALLGTPAAAQTLLDAFPGSQNFQSFGARAAALGDIDGDGYPDLIASGSNSTTELVRVFSGRFGNTLYEFTATGVDLGSWLAGAGDMDADGHRDFVIGSNEEVVSGDKGVARAYSGATGALLYTFYAQGGTDAFGQSVAGLEDINGDGHSDIAVGAPGYNNNVGRVRVFSGIDGSTLYTFDGTGTLDSFGESVAGCGDVNADGVPDIIIGAPQFGAFGVPKGYARVYSGSTGSLLYTFNGQNYTDGFGYRVAGAGDVDSDGHADLIVGALDADVGGFSECGSARVISGATGLAIYTRSGGANNAWAAQVAGGSDYDGDGKPDVAVGAPNEDGGRVRVYRGYDGFLLQTLNGVPNEGLGMALGFVGDYDHNGDVDLFVGVPVGNTTGECRVYSRSSNVFDRFCPTSPNSVGPGARIDHTGTSSIAANNLTLTADSLPAGKSALFFFGNQVLQVPFADGVRCASGQLWRLPVATSDLSGNLAYFVDFRSSLSQIGVLTAGSTWHFQTFYRDTGFGIYGLNTSDALSVGFGP